MLFWVGLMYLKGAIYIFLAILNIIIFVDCLLCKT